MFNKDYINIEEELNQKGLNLLNYHVLEGIADWVRVVDRDGYIIYANKAMIEDLGADIVGIKCKDAHCKVNNCDKCITDRTIKTGDTVQKEQKINGDYYSVKSSPVRDSNGEIYAAVEVFRNVTRERRLEKKLIEKNNEMNSDINFAKKIQEKILPRKGIKSGLEIDYIYKPSEMLSGDMFDLFRIDKDNIGVYISDVSGNGVAASMMTMFIRQTMRVMKDEIKSPSKALSELHQRFLDLNLEIDNYFTIFYGIFNKKDNTFRYSNAGHNCVPIQFNDKEIKMLKNKGYPITSLLDRIDYVEKVTDVAKGDSILLYTDGVTEVKNALGVEFGYENLLEIIKRKPDNLLEQIDIEVTNYSWGEHQDDVAIVLLNIK